jgi:hypothetical protein
MSINSTTEPNVNSFIGTGINWIIGGPNSGEHTPGSVPLDDDDDDDWRYLTVEDAVLDISWFGYGAGGIDYDALDVDQVNHALMYCAGKTLVVLPPLLTGDKKADWDKWEAWDTEHGEAWEKYEAACSDIIVQRGRSQPGAPVHGPDGQPFRPTYQNTNVFEMIPGVNAQNLVDAAWKDPVTGKLYVDEQTLLRLRTPLPRLANDKTTSDVSIPSLNRPPLVPGNYKREVAFATFNAHFFRCAPQGIVEDCYGQIFDDGSVKWYSTKQLQDQFAGYNVIDVVIDGRAKRNKLKETSAVKAWHDFSLKRHAKVVFDPSDLTGPNEVNLWTGFAHHRDTGRDLIEGFIEHLQTNIAKGNAEVFEYVVNWLAHAVQFPHLPMPVALILYGKEMGTGKSFVGRILKNLFKDAHAKRAVLKDLFGSFNVHTLTWSYVWLDEAVIDTWNERDLRGLLTSPTRRMEIKGGAVTHPTNCLHILITNNAVRPVPVADTDRRYAAFVPGTAQMQNKAYFKKIEDALDAGGYGQLLDYLMEIDLSNWNPEAIPSTAERELLKDLSADVITQWLMDAIDDGEFDKLSRKDAKGNWVHSATSPVIKQMYAAWRATSCAPHPGNRIITARMTEVFGESKSRDGGKSRTWDVSDAAAKLDRWRGRKPVAEAARVKEKAGDPGEIQATATHRTKSDDAKVNGLLGKKVL